MLVSVLSTCKARSRVCCTRTVHIQCSGYDCSYMHCKVCRFWGWSSPCTFRSNCASRAVTFPEDILVFMQCQLPAQLSSLQHPTATVESHLSKEFELLGRTANFNPHSQQGNPVESLHLREFAKGYKNHAAELGYQKSGAVPLEKADMIQFLQQLYLQQQTSVQAQINCCY